MPIKEFFFLITPIKLQSLNNEPYGFNNSITDNFFAEQPINLQTRNYNNIQFTEDSNNRKNNFRNYNTANSYDIEVKEGYGSTEKPFNNYRSSNYYEPRKEERYSSDIVYKDSFIKKNNYDDANKGNYTSKIKFSDINYEPKSNSSSMVTNFNNISRYNKSSNSINYDLKEVSSNSNFNRYGKYSNVYSSGNRFASNYSTNVSNVKDSFKKNKENNNQFTNNKFSNNIASRPLSAVTNKPISNYKPRANKFVPFRKTSSSYPQTYGASTNNSVVPQYVRSSEPSPLLQCLINNPKES